MRERIAGLTKLRRSSWSAVSALALCSISIFLLSACAGGPRPDTVPVPTSALTPTTTHASAPTDSPAPAFVPTATVESTDGEPDAAVEPTVPSVTSPSAPAPAPSALPSPRWILHSLDDRPVVQGSLITMVVGENTLGGHDGCNNYGGEADDGTPVFGTDGVFSLPGLAIQLAGCPEPEDLMGDQADAYMSALVQGERYRVVGDRQEIIDKRGGTRIVFRRLEPLRGHPIDLSRTAWRLLTDDDGDGDLRAATMVFLGDRTVTGVTACRAYVADYWMSKAKGSMGFNLWPMFGSQEACPEESRKVGGEYWEFLWRAWEYSVHDEAESRRLGIRSPEGKTLTFEPLPPIVEEIADTEWTLTTLVELLRSGTLQDTTVVEGTEVTISFDKDGVSGTSGCNSYEGLSRIEDGSITIDVQSLMHTEEVCERPDGVMEQEDWYLGVLPRLTRYGVFGDELFLQTDLDRLGRDDVRFLVFQTK